MLTERNDHLGRFEQELATRLNQLVVLRAGMGKKQRHAIKSVWQPSRATKGESLSPLASTLARDSTIPVWTRCF